MNTTEKVYNAIIAHVLEWNYPPTVRELCEICNLASVSSVHWHLHKLERQGKVIIANNAPRSIKLCEYEVELKYKKIEEEEPEQKKG